MAFWLFLLAGFFLTLLLVVGVHEAGHFLGARLLGIRVLKFSLGFGRKIVSFHDRQKTEYLISAIPLGGYVSLLEDKDATDTDRHQVFSRQTFWKRFIVIAAGPFTNLLLALLLYWIIFMVGFTSVLPVTGNILKPSIANTAGIRPNQTITHIDDIAVTSWTGVIIRIMEHVGNHDTLRINTQNRRTGKIQQHHLDLSGWQMNPLKPNILGSLGLTPWLPVHPSADFQLPQWLLHHNQYGPYNAFVHAFQNTRDFTLLNLKMIGRMLAGKISLKSLGGPFSIFGQAGMALHQGAIAFMSFVAFLSIAVGVLNILPIPGLDGGHLFFQLIEAVRGKPISEKWLALFYRLGIIFIGIIFIQALANDLMRLK